MCLLPDVPAGHFLAHSPGPVGQSAWRALRGVPGCPAAPPLCPVWPRALRCMRRPRPRLHNDEGPREDAACPPRQRRWCASLPPMPGSLPCVSPTKTALAVCGSDRNFTMVGHVCCPPSRVSVFGDLRTHLRGLPGVGVLQEPECAARSVGRGTARQDSPRGDGQVQGSEP